MTDEINNAAGSIINTIVTMTFVALKLSGNIDWSWWWVLSPLWIPIVLILIILAGFGVLKLFRVI